jgi:hypothetical protein
MARRKLRALDQLARRIGILDSFYLVMEGHLPKLNRYKVSIYRQYLVKHSINVEAKNEQEAQDLALDLSDNMDHSKRLQLTGTGSDVKKL